jgi:SAM-dependent methyltransferase
MSGVLSFWSQRLRKHGHTGWADPVVYAYDQLERLKLIEAELSKRPIKGGNALDFGCGSGDFSKLLLSMGFRVCGYDPFVKPRIRSGQFTYASTYERIPFRNHAADLALTVTTLDHILEERDLLNALGTIRDCLKESAVFYMLEYALDIAADRIKFGLKNNYQSFRTVSEWMELLALNSFRVLDVARVSHPVISPSSGYIAYSRTPLVRIRRRYPHWPLARFWYDRLLKWQAAKLVPKAPLTSEFNSDSPLKLIRCLPT